MTKKRGRKRVPRGSARFTWPPSRERGGERTEILALSAYRIAGKKKKGEKDAYV